MRKHHWILGNIIVFTILIVTMEIHDTRTYISTSYRSSSSNRSIVRSDQSDYFQTMYDFKSNIISYMKSIFSTETTSYPSNKKSLETTDSRKENLMHLVEIDNSRSNDSEIQLRIKALLNKIARLNVTFQLSKTTKQRMSLANQSDRTNLSGSQSNSRNVNDSKTPSRNLSNPRKEILDNGTTKQHFLETYKNTTFGTLKSKIVPQVTEVMAVKTTVQQKHKQNEGKKEKCFHKSMTDVISEGEWVLKDNITQNEIDDRFKKDEEIRISNDWSPKLYRRDRRCGKTIKIPGYRLFSQCDPAGKHPCCNEDKKLCGNGAQFCQCKNCTDFTAMISAELYEWTPKRCKLSRIEWNHSCKLLHKNNISLYFMGDSLIRHVHTGLLLHLTNDYTAGSIPQNTTIEVKQQCKGVVQMTKRKCSVESVAQSTLELPRNSLCKGLNMNLNIEMLQDYHASLIPKISNKIDELMDQENAWIVGGVGLHYQLDFARLKREYLDLVMKKLNSSRNGWPRMIWFENHGVSGFLREVAGPNNKRIELFNEIIKKYLTDHNIDTIPTFKISDNVRSYDGRHYGIGFNELKVRLLINYLEQYYKSGKE